MEFILCVFVCMFVHARARVCIAWAEGDAHTADERRGGERVSSPLFVPFSGLQGQDQPEGRPWTHSSAGSVPRSACESTHPLFHTRSLTLSLDRSDILSSQV